MIYEGAVVSDFSIRAEVITVNTNGFRCSELHCLARLEWQAPSSRAAASPVTHQGVPADVWTALVIQEELQ